MEPATREIDPNGDTLLILRKPDGLFAVDNSFRIWPRALPQYWTRDKHQSEWDLQNSALVKSPTFNGKPDAKMRLSSKHLTLASAYFQKMLANNWIETDSNNGYSYTVIAEEWDTQALLILMNIIHGQTQNVPQKVDLETLTKIAVLVDYYKCHKAIEFFAKAWTSHLTQPLPSSYGRELLLRLLTSIVFREADTFRKLTKTIIYESRGQIHSLGLPIPKNVIDALDTKREKHISNILSSLYDLKAQFYKENTECSFECYSLSLGALMKGMNAMKLLDPPLKPPYWGYSVIMMEKAIRDIRMPDYDHAPQHHMSAGFMGLNSGYGRPTHRPCSLSTKITSIIDEQLKKLGGLRLEDVITRE